MSKSSTPKTYCEIKDFDGSVAISKISEKQKDELCRGKEIRPLNEIAKLKCFYGHNDSPWLKIGPFKIEENALDPYHVTILELLYEHECNDITEFLGPMLNFPPGKIKLNLITVFPRIVSV